MSMTSILIPSRNEKFLTKTIKDILNKAAGEIEVIVNIDSNWPEEIVEDKRVTYIHPDNPVGLRGGVNLAVKHAKGEFLMKTDAHCMFAEGFDETLKADCDDNWIVIPRRWSLDVENWAIEKNGKPPRDYHYLCFPDPTKDKNKGMHGIDWFDRVRQRINDPQYDIDETMSFQGSCWFMKKKWFTDFIGEMDVEHYGLFAQEPQEIGNKTWLGGGKIMTNKKTWYAHLHKGSRYGRMYAISQNEINKGHNWSAWYWMNNKWEDRLHDMSWLIERFWPVPTWPEDRSLWVSPVPGPEDLRFMSGE